MISITEWAGALGADETDLRLLLTILSHVLLSFGFRYISKARMPSPDVPFYR